MGIRSCFTLFTFLLMSFMSCDSESVVGSYEKENSDISVYQYPNILDYSGVPDSLTDRSVFVFSDLGAWFGYSLPGHNSELTDYSGPFIMTQDNGIWISKNLTKLSIVENESGSIQNGPITDFSATSYPGMLQIRYTRDSLDITSKLIFVSDRSALVGLTVKNLHQTDRTFQVEWHGESFLPGTRLAADPDGILITFDGNNNLGLIAVSDAHRISIPDTDSTAYTIISEESFYLTPGEQITKYYTHSFCFSEDELNNERTLLASVFRNPEAYFEENEFRWLGYLSVLLNARTKWMEEPAYRNIAVKCLLTLINNWRSPAGELLHDGIFPSYNEYWFNGLWAWDTWKTAVGVADFHPELAKNQVRALFDFQDETGMIADCVFRDTLIEGHNWRNTKPPLAGWAVWKVYEKTEDLEFLREMFPKLEKYFNWWYKYRDHNENVICEYGSTDGTVIAGKWESGMDNAVRFDIAGIVQNEAKAWSLTQESVDLNSYLYAEKLYFGNIAEALDQIEKRDAYKRDAIEIKTKIQDHFFDETKGSFYDFNTYTGSLVDVEGPEGWIPLWAEVASREQAKREKMIMCDTSKFATYIPFPTLSADHPEFQPQNGYWRGPVWLDQAYFAIRGLEKYGHTEEADNFTKQLFDRLEGLRNDNGPIRENYNPLTGEGLEANHFSWSAVHLLLLLTES